MRQQLLTRLFGGHGKKDFVQFVAKRSDIEKRHTPKFSVINDVKGKKSEEDDPIERPVWWEWHHLNGADVRLECIGGSMLVASCFGGHWQNCKDSY